MTDDNVIPINRERKELIHSLEAHYSPHSYNVYKVHPPAKVMVRGFSEPQDAPWVVVNMLNPRYYVSAHRHASEAIRAAEQIRDQHYREYLEVLSAEDERRGYSNQDVVDIIDIQMATEAFRNGVKMSRSMRNRIDKLIKKHPSMLVTEALQLHAERARKLWEESGKLDDIWYYVDMAAKPDSRLDL